MTYRYFIFAIVLLFDKDGFLAYCSTWSYSGEAGPDHWEGTCTTGSRQSPINIVTADAVEIEIPPLVFTGYDQTYEDDVINTGHTVEFDYGNESIKLEGGGLSGAYILSSMHFHWGSEHTLDGEEAVIELHFLHHSEKYNSTTEAAEYEDGIAVVAVLFDLSDEDNEDLDVILEGVKTVSLMNSTTTAHLHSELIPVLLIPDDHSFYRYSGSLTTPNCQESVVWTILTSKIPISSSQVDAFHHVESIANVALVSNNRPIQSLGDRIVYHHVDYA